MSKKRKLEQADGDIASKAVKGAFNDAPRIPPTEKYDPPTSQWLLENRLVLPCITLSSAMAICGSLNAAGDFVLNPYLVTLRQLIRYRNVSAFVNMLYSFRPGPDIAVSYVCVIAKKKEWLFAFAAQGKFAIGGNDFINHEELSFDPETADKELEEDMNELIYHVKYCPVVSCHYRINRTAVRDWLNASDNRLSMYSKFRERVSDMTSRDQARDIFRELFRGKSNSDNAVMEESTNDPVLTWEIFETEVLPRLNFGALLGLGGTCRRLASTWRHTVTTLPETMLQRLNVDAVYRIWTDVAIGDKLESMRVGDACIVVFDALLTLNLDFFIGGISDDALSRLTTLTDLRLSRNRLITSHGVSRLTSLTRLDLNDNCNIDGPTVASLTRLRHLEINANRRIADAHLRHLTSLTRLDLTNNDLISDSTLVHHLTGLRFLSLSENDRITVAVLRRLTSLTHLGLAGNRRVTNDDLLHLTLLTSLDLVHNVVIDMKALALQLPNLARVKYIRGHWLDPRRHMHEPEQRRLGFITVPNFLPGLFTPRYTVNDQVSDAPRPYSAPGTGRKRRRRRRGIQKKKKSDAERAATAASLSTDDEESDFDMSDLFGYSGDY